MSQLTSIYLKQVRSFPNAFKKLFLETKTVANLRYAKSLGRPLTRRECIMVKKNSESLGKVALFAVVQAIPIIGWLPMLVAIAYPRYLLTEHFWNDEQKELFMRQEYMERCKYALELRDHIDSLSTITIQFSMFNLGGKFTSLGSLSRRHIKLLAGANAIHGSYMSHRFTPSFMTQWTMEKVASFILNDDRLLNTEGIEDLTNEELKEALLQRGFNIPSDFNTDISIHQHALRSWLHITTSREAPISLSSYILHAMALPEIQPTRQLSQNIEQRRKFNVRS
mmetsp:Transcript_12391/g.12010  ORF Transcript_12391/g.12010 Transcript_12391/m.12010 type:complete len:281 (-) Transcript_12391:108-950(-)